MKSILIASLLVFTTAIGYGQNKHHFDFSLGRYKAYGTYKFHDNDDKIHTAQWRYQFDFNKNVGIYIAVNRAPTGGNTFAAERGLADTNGIGKRQAWGKYYFYDLGLNYNLYQYKHHCISVNAALSYAKGEDIYLKSMIWLPSWSGGPGFHIIEFENENKKAAYWGAVAGLRYDYYFNKDRCKVGAYFSGRYYGNDFPFQLNYGLGIGYVFFKKVKI